MYKVLFLLFLAAAYCLKIEQKQPNGNTEDKAKGSNTVTQPSVIPKKSSTIVPSSMNCNLTDTQDLSCKMEDGTNGECVRRYLCNENKRINTDGIGILDARQQEDSCACDLDICCRVEDKGPQDDPRKPITEPKKQPNVNTNDKSEDLIVGTLPPGITKPPSTVVPPMYCNSINFQGQPCELEDKTIGECVSYTLCNANNTIIEDGVGIIDIRGLDPICPCYMDTCCSVGDKRSQEDPRKPIPEPQRKGCGWRNPKGADLRTTGETAGETKFGEFPWMVAIFRVEPKHNTSLNKHAYIAGGSLIHPSAVLTAAHHVANPGTYKARAGEWDTQNEKEIYPYQERDVASVAIHKDFNKGNLFYSIALLFLDRPMDLAPNVGVACLPPPKKETPAGTRCFATGWGKDKFGKDGQYQVIMKKIELPVVDRTTCQTALRKTRLGRRFQLHVSFMCAGGELGKDTCEGDGGSPLSCPIENEENRYIQSGIVAWGIDCGQDGTPGVYVDVAKLRDWIDDKIAGKGYDLNTYSYNAI